MLLVIDQRRLPDELVEVEVRNGPEAANAIRQMVVRGAPAIGQVAAIGLALTRGAGARRRSPTPGGRSSAARRAALRGVPADGGQPRLGGRPDDGPLRGGRRPRPRTATTIAAAMRDEADAIVAEATTDHGRLAEFGLAVAAGQGLRAAPDPDPLQHRAARLRPVRDGARDRPGRPPRRPRDHVWVDETRPVPPGRPADRVGARAGRRPAHADPGRRGRAR